jgi:protein KTI12
MPCLVLTGHPSVGKTTFAKLLSERALNHSSNIISSVEIVNEESVCLDRSKSSCYSTSQTEKATRSALKAKVDRSLQDKTLVICDSMNYIKGYRYELHCISKAAKQKHGIIWILNAQAMEWNRTRREMNPENSFSDDQMKELIQRYEPPDSRNRWDQPLWRVDLSPSFENTDVSAKAALEQSVYNMHDLSVAMNGNLNTASEVPSTISKNSDLSTKGSSFKRIRPNNRKLVSSNGVEECLVPKETVESNDKYSSSPRPTIEEQIDAILDEFLFDVAPLKEGLSTRQHINANSNVLHDADSLTLQVCNALVAAQSQNYGSFVTVDGFGDPIQIKCKRHIPLTELKRLRKQYVRWISKIPPQDTSHRGLAVSFLKYLEEQIEN